MKEFSRTFQLDEWSCEITQIRVRKTDKFGKPYTAIATVTITDGVAHAEGFLSTEKPTKKDLITLEKLKTMLEVDECEHSRYKKPNIKAIK
jgi:hypothetical protein